MGVYKAVYGAVPPAANGAVVIDNTVKIRPAQACQPEITEPVEQDGQTAVGEQAKAAERKAQEERKRAFEAEIEAVKEYYRDEGEKALEEARIRAEKILDDTKKQAQQYAEGAKAQAQELFEKAKEDGFSKGHDDGYKAGLMKCRDMLLELKQISEDINRQKQELFEGYETEIFDTVMEIANRVTVNSLAQKDKAVIRKTIKEAAKAFYNSDYIKLTLSKTDVTQEMTADADFFKKLFVNAKTVEVEVLKDAPTGTVIIDDGSEITDAGIQTQLKMIEELGRGKYRRTPSKKKQQAADTSAFDEAEPLSDAKQE